jgi:polynucleotide 5'-kinase involved in rRNA processing
VIIFLFLNLKKLKIIIKINPTHLIDIEQQNKKKTTTKIQNNNAKLITITTKV